MTLPRTCPGNFYLYLLAENIFIQNACDIAKITSTIPISCAFSELLLLQTMFEPLHFHEFTLAIVINHPINHWYKKVIVIFQTKKDFIITCSKLIINRPGRCKTRANIEETWLAVFTVAFCLAHAKHNFIKFKS